MAIEPVETIDKIKNTVAQLIQFWLEKILESKNGETIFLPIDFSDQYTGCLKVQNQDGNLILTYGFSRREGYTIVPSNPENFYTNITDFEADSEKQITIEQPIFITALDRQIRKLKGVAS